MRTVRLSNVQLPEEPVKILNYRDMLYPLEHTVATLKGMLRRRR